MNCTEKYRDWIMDASLDAIAPERGRELRAHIAECDGCREAYEQARRFAAAVDRGVESLIAGEPSPRLAARVRARIADERPATRFTWLGWGPATALALVSILVIAGVLWTSSRRNAARKTIPFGRELASVGAPAHPADSTAVPTGTPASSQTRSSLSAQLPTEPARTGTSRAAQPGDLAVARLVPPRHPAPRTNSPAEPEVIVPPGQLQAVMQLAAAIRSGRIDGKQLLAAQKDIDNPIEIPPLEIKPLEIPPAGSDTATSLEPPASSSNR